MKKKVLLGGLLVGMVTSFMPATAALADDPTTDITEGGCGFNTVEQATATNGLFEGVIYDLSATTDVNHVPLNSTVECWIQVDGGDVTPHFTFPFGAVAGPAAPVQAGVSTPITFGASATDTVTLCQVTHYPGGDGPTVCPTATTTQIPPQVVFDTLQTVLDLVNGVFASTIDPKVCPILGSLAPGVGPVVIDPTGDVSIVPDPTSGLFPPGLLTPVYDCPPYVTGG